MRRRASCGPALMDVVACALSLVLLLLGFVTMQLGYVAAGAGWILLTAGLLRISKTSSKRRGATTSPG